MASDSQANDKRKRQATMKLARLKAKKEESAAPAKKAAKKKAS